MISRLAVVRRERDRARFGLRLTRRWRSEQQVEVFFLVGTATTTWRLVKGRRYGRGASQAARGATGPRLFFQARRAAGQLISVFSACSAPFLLRRRGGVVGGAKGPTRSTAPAGPAPRGAGATRLAFVESRGGGPSRRGPGAPPPEVLKGSAEGAKVGGARPMDRAPVLPGRASVVATNSSGHGLERRARPRGSARGGGRSKTVAHGAEGRRDSPSRSSYAGSGPPARGAEPRMGPAGAAAATLLVKRAARLGGHGWIGVRRSWKRTLVGELPQEARRARQGAWWVPAHARTPEKQRAVHFVLRDENGLAQAVLGKRAEQPEASSTERGLGAAPEIRGCAKFVGPVNGADEACEDRPVRG